MFKAISIVNKKNFYYFYNILMYTLQRIPFIKKIVKDKVYNISGIDSAINTLSFFFSIIASFIKKIFMYGWLLNVVFVYNLYNLLLEADFVLLNENIEKDKLYIYFLFVFMFFGALIQLFYFYDNGHLETYIFVKQMKIRPRDYYLGTFFYQTVIYIVTLAPVLKIIFLVMGIEISIIEIISYIIFLYSLKYLFASIFLLFNIKSEKIINIIIKAQWILIVFLFIAFVSFIPLTNSLIDFVFLFDVKFGFLGLIIFAISTLFIIKSDKIDEIAYNSLNYSKITSVYVDELRIKQVKMKDGKITRGEKDFSRYEGIEYINKIFFYRTSKILRTKKITGYLIRIVIFSLIAVASFIFKNEVLQQTNDIKFLTEYMHILLFLASYFTFSGDFFIKYCFYNMDVSIMRNKFYRNKDILLKSMKIRVIELLKYYMIPFIFYLTTIVVISINFNIAMKNVLLNILFATLGWLVFSFHHLFAYYILQPFTQGMQIKSPLYTWLTYLIYMFGYFSIKSGVSGLFLTYLFLIFSVIYITLGFLGMMYLAPKRFKLR